MALEARSRQSDGVSPHTPENEATATPAPHDGAAEALADERVFKPRRALPTDVVRPTRAEVNLSHLRHNLHVLRGVSSARSGPPPKIWAVLKADAYGHGAKAVARTLERAGVDGMCVALVEEGVELREAGIGGPVLVMGGYYKSAFDELLHHGLTPVLHEAAQIEELARTVRSRGAGRARAHLKVDTGMGRLGAPRNEWAHLAETLAAHPEVHFEGLMTHFANADLPESGVLDEPLSAFAEARATFARAGLTPELTHAANSAALLRGGASFDLVRPGIALFGVSPWPAAGTSEAPAEALGKLRPVMSLFSKVVALRDLAVGQAVGYGSTWRAERPSRIATIPIGYADGLSRALSNRGSMLLRGRHAPIVGIVSMDMTMLDVTDIEGVALADDVVVLGTQKWPPERGAGPPFEAQLGARDLARSSGTIAWEVLTNVSRRVPRFYREP